MSKIISTKNIVKTFASTDFAAQCAIPLGYNIGLPVLSIRNGKPTLILPFLKYKITGEVDKTLIYPIRYTVTVNLPNVNPVAFENLEYNRVFSKVDFAKPVGYFRHEAIKALTRKEYVDAKNKLYTRYDRLIAAALDEKEPSATDVAEFRELISTIIEPSLKPIYKALDKDFYDKYLG